MYEEHFGFSGPPFRLNPDPKFFFGSRSHNKAMAYLHYGLRQGEGFIVISGEIGAGKSMLIGHLIDQLDRSNVVAANLLTTNVEPDALLSHILSAFRIEPAGTGKSAEIDAFEDFLYEQMNRGRRVLLIVDEAQNLPFRTIEELRMLSNMDYEGTPLFQVFLVGQPEFRVMLAKPDMEQFRQRVIASYHLEPLGIEETQEYVEYRLTLVGWNKNPSFTPEAFERIFVATGGVPRKINRLCNRILLHCSIEKLGAVDGDVVNAVYADLKGESLEHSAAQASAAPRRGARKKVRTGSHMTGEPPVQDEIAMPVVLPPEGVRKIVPPTDVMAAPAAAPVSPTSSPHMQQSALDRLRALRAREGDAGDGGAFAAVAEAAREPATLVDVKRAIEAISSGETPPPPTESDGAAPAMPAEIETWRLSVVQSIDATRQELKTAYANVASLRLRLTDLESRRRDRRMRISAGLSRAETLLSELRSAHG